MANQKNNAEVLAKARAARILPRKYSDSPAGHFADKLNGIKRKLERIKAQTSKWDENIADWLRPAEDAVKEAAEVFTKLAEADFRPTPSRGGQRTKIAAGAHVWLKPDVYALLLKEGYAEEDLENLYVSNSAQPGEKQVFLRCGSGDATAAPFGPAVRASLTTTRPDYSAQERE